MKKLILNIVWILIIASAKAQDSTNVTIAKNTINSNVKHKVKSANQVLPNKAFDINYFIGSNQSNATMINMKTAYETAGLTNSSFKEKTSTPTYNSQGTNGINLQFAYFFNKSRHFGFGLGAQLMQNKGVYTITDYSIQFASKDKNNATFRQLLTSKSPIVENVTTTNINIPIVLKYKHQFADRSALKRFGVAIDAGLLLGVNNTNKFDGKGIFNYEAVYKYDANGIAIYDNNAENIVKNGNVNFNVTADNNSKIITSEYWLANTTTDGSVLNYFDRKFSEGFNVGLNKNASGSGKTNYNVIPSYGFIVQPAVTYYLGYNVTFMIGGYFSSQTFKNTNNTNYRLTDNLVDVNNGNYNSITSGIQKTTNTSIGGNIGLRIFFGEKRDSDGDGVIDIKDLAPMDYGCMKDGTLTKTGAPDYDGDGVSDEKDDCYDVEGDAENNGCPDTDLDGIIDSKDKCKTEPGIASNNPERNGCPFDESDIQDYLTNKGLTIVKAETEKVIEKSPEKVEEYFDVMSKDFINFDFAKADLLESSKDAIDNAIKILNANPNLIIYISGHTDDIGTDEKNMKLSFIRANAVSQYLQEKGIAEERIIAIGYGNKKPLNPSKDENGRAQNRRTEIKLLSPIKSKPKR
jgi:outer membrane protein OmpA-like peptidoglycan-associated protein